MELGVEAVRRRARAVEAVPNVSTRFRAWLTAWVAALVARLTSATRRMKAATSAGAAPGSVPSRMGTTSNATGPARSVTSPPTRFASVTVYGPGEARKPPGDSSSQSLSSTPPVSASVVG